MEKIEEKVKLWAMTGIITSLLDTQEELDITDEELGKMANFSIKLYESVLLDHDQQVNEANELLRLLIDDLLTD